MKNVMVSLKVSKKLLVLIPLICQVSAAGAALPDLAPARTDTEIRETVVHTAAYTMDVDLNEKTVLCSSADYDGPMLKVLIPGLAEVTLLDHQNFGANAPCVTTGESCLGFGSSPRAKPEDILQGRNGIEPVEVTVTEKRIETINHTEQLCSVILNESVETKIRGKRLFHVRQHDLGLRRYSSCLKGL